MVITNDVSEINRCDDKRTFKGCKKTILEVTGEGNASGINNLNQILFHLLPDKLI